MELETALEDVRRELDESREGAIESWTRVNALRPELDESRERVVWLRSRMRIYKNRISELEGAATDNRDEREFGSGTATTATPAMSGPAPALQQTPVVTQLSVHAQSPSRAEPCMTVSACRYDKSASGTSTAKLFKRTLSKPASGTKAPGDQMSFAASRTATTTTKRSLFSQTSRVQPPKPQEAQASSSSAGPFSASVSGVACREWSLPAASSSRLGLAQKEAADAKTATPNQEHGMSRYSSYI